MKSKYALWLGTFIAVVGFILTFSLKISYTIIIAGALIQVYAIYLVKQE